MGVVNTPNALPPFLSLHPLLPLGSQDRLRPETRAEHLTSSTDDTAATADVLAVTRDSRSTAVAATASVATAVAVPGLLLAAVTAAAALSDDTPATAATAICAPAALSFFSASEGVCGSQASTAPPPASHRGRFPTLLG